MRKIKAVITATFIAAVMTVTPAFADWCPGSCNASTQSCVGVPASYTYDPAPDLLFMSFYIDIGALSVIEMCEYIAKGLSW